VLLKTLARLGYRPQLAACAVCGAALARDLAAFSARHGGALCAACAPPGNLALPAALLGALERGLRSPLRERAALGLDRESVLRAERLLADFFRFHVGFEPRSAGFLKLSLERVDGPRDPRDTPPARAPGPTLR